MQVEEEPKTRKIVKQKTTNDILNELINKENHSQKLKCNLCDKTCINASVLNVHKNMQHKDASSNIGDQRIANVTKLTKDEMLNNLVKTKRLMTFGPDFKLFDEAVLGLQAHVSSKVRLGPSENVFDFDEANYSPNLTFLTFLTDKPPKSVKVAIDELPEALKVVNEP